MRGVSASQATSPKAIRNTPTTMRMFRGEHGACRGSRFLGSLRRARAMDGDRRDDEADTDELRGREPEHSATCIAAQDLDDRSRDRIERKERREDLPIVTLAREDDVEAHERDDER